MPADPTLYTSAPNQDRPLLSSLRGDPDMRELIELFVDEIPERVRLVRDFWDRRELGELKRLAHQLKGACGGYGFPQVGAAAGALEQSLSRAADRAAKADLSVLAGQVNELIALCGRVRVS